MHDIVIGIDLGATNIKAGVVGADGKVLFRTRLTTDADKGPENVADRMARAARQCVENVEGGKKGVAGIGIGSPGPLDLESGVVVFAPNMDGWDNVPLRAMIEERTGLTCTIENDGNAAALAEQWVGAGRGASSLVIFTLGTGIGGGIVLDGKVLHGVGGVAAEMGHMSINPDGPVCGCGNKGCIEAYASAPAMVRRMREAIAGGRSTSLAARAKRLTSKDIYEAALAGDEAARENMEMTGFYLGVTVTNIMHLLNPEVIVFSGGVTAAGDMLMAPILRTVEERAMESSRRGARVCFAELGEDAGVIGAARSFTVMREVKSL